jgi:hypothetical protein
VVSVCGDRPRAVPVPGRYHVLLLAAARFAGDALICGGTDPGRRNIANPLTRALDGGTGLPRLDTSRLRMTWLRDPGAWALPLRAAGAQLVQDLHPHDRGPKGTRHGSIIANGNLYCPRTPRSLTEPGPLARDGRDKIEVTAHGPHASSVESITNREGATIQCGTS